MSSTPRKLSATIAILLCMGGVTSCNKHAPAPQPSAAAESKPAEPSAQDLATPMEASIVPSAAAETVLHTLAEGETLWDIARAYGVSIDQIMQQNGFRPEDARRLRTGRQLKLSGVTRVLAPGEKIEHNAKPAPLPELTDGAYHMLRRGESLWTLARLYDVPIEAIMTRNGFTEDVHGQLQIGQPIIIPGLHKSQIKQAPPEPVASAEPQKRATGGMSHDVVRGETVWDIAHSYGVSVAEIMAANHLDADAVASIREGQKLFLPGIESDDRGHVQHKKTAREGRANAVARQLGLGGLQAAGMLLHGRVDARWIAAAGGGKGLAGTLRWPVSQGWFVRGFGSGQGGYHKAMDIMGKIGWNVRAAADGIVGYSGDKVPGFGNMVMVVHPGGWVTLYAHNSVNFVSAGEHVAKGAVLAEVGSTGRSTGPHVHFELIYDGKNCDPAPLFRPGVRHRSGKFSSIEYTSWRSAGKRPKTVQCAVRQKHPQPVVSEDPAIDVQRVDERDTRDLPAFDDLSDLFEHKP